MPIPRPTPKPIFVSDDIPFMADCVWDAGEVPDGNWRDDDAVN